MTPAPNRPFSAGDANDDGTYTVAEGFDSLTCGCSDVGDDDQSVGIDSSAGVGGSGSSGSSESGDTWYEEMG